MIPHSTSPVTAGDVPDQRTGELQAVRQMAEIFCRATDPEEIYDAAMDILQAALGANRVSILEFDEGLVMRFRAWRGLSDGYRQAAEGHSPWPAGETDPQVVLWPDAAEEPSLDEELRKTILNEGVRALAFVPLVHGGRLLGKFMLYYDEPHNFSGEELDLAQSIAASVAAVIERRQSWQAWQYAYDALEHRTTQRATRLQQEIAQRKAAEAALQLESKRLRLMQEISQAANDAESVEAAFETALELICTFTGWPLAHVYVNTPSETEEGVFALVSSGVWRCDEEQFIEFREFTAGKSFTLDEEWVGEVVTSGRPVWISEVAAEERFVRRAMLAEGKIRSGFAFPVTVGDEVVAVLEFYSPEEQEPDDVLLEIMGYVGVQLGRVVERERAAAEIRRSRDFYLTLFEAFPTPMWRTNEDGQCNFVNQAWLAYTGRTLSEELGDRWLERVHPDDRERVAQNARQALEARTGFTIEYRLKRHDGRYCWFADYGQPYYTPEGDFAGYIGAAYDITSRQEALARLQASEQQLAEAQRMARLGSFEWELQSNRLTWSAEMYRIYGLDPETFEPTLDKIASMIHPDDQIAFAGRTAQAATGREPLEFLVRIIRPDGQERVLSARRLPVFDEQGNLVRIFGAAQDVTEQRRAQLQIARTTRQLAALNEMGQTVVSSLDVDEVLARVLEEVRTLLKAEAAYILLYDTPDSLIIVAAQHDGARSLAGSRVPADAGVAGEALRQGKALLVRGAEAQEQGHKVILQAAPDGPPQAILAAPLYARGQSTGVMEVLHRDPDAFDAEALALVEGAAAWTSIALTNADLHQQVQVSRFELRRLAEQLINAQERERQRISLALHDDAGQALSALKMKLDLVAAGLAGEANSQLKEAGKLLEKTVSEIRNLSYNLRPPELDTVGLNVALEDLCWQFARRTGLKISYEGSEPAYALPDSTSLSFYRFLQEALTNVGKHAQAEKVRVRFQMDEDAAELWVEDDGRGFDPQLSAAAPEGWPGLGLLAMRERFERLDGSLTISSQAGEGTVLHGRIPH